MKLSDFGISEIVEDGHDELKNNAGTKFFMSPEAWEGKAWTYLSYFKLFSSSSLLPWHVERDLKRIFLEILLWERKQEGEKNLIL